MQSKRRFPLPCLIIIIGIALIAYGSNQLRIRNQPVNPNAFTTEPPSLGGQLYPSELIINKLELDLPITLASIKNGVWDNPEATVAYWKDSPLPNGNRGNSVFYGHNWPNIFGKLKDLEKNDVFTIVFNNGSKRDFIVETKSVVTSDQTHILEQTKDARVTLYTCTGFLDSRRLVIVGVPIQ